MIPCRALTITEIATVPPGLAAAVPLDEIRLIGRHHPVSWLAILIGRGPQVVVRGKRIFWPGLPEDMGSHPALTAVLAHELVHVWQYANGMTLWRYVLRERGVYGYRLDGRPFTGYGYEQQAAMVEDWARLRAGLAVRWGAGIDNKPVDMAALEATVPLLCRTT